MKKIALTSGFALFLVATAWAGENNRWEPFRSYITPDTIGLEAGIWRATMTGSLQANQAGSGTQIDVSADLDLEEDAQFTMGRAWLRISDEINIRGMIWMGSIEGEATLTTGVTFAGTTFSGLVDSELEFSMSGAVLDVPLSLGVMDIQLSLQLGARYLAVDAKLTEVTSGTEAQENVGSPIPVGGVRLRIQPDAMFLIEAEAQGLTFTYQDVEVRVLDLTVEVGFIPTSSMYVGVGYRTVQFLADDTGTAGEEIKIDIEMDGGYAVVGFTF